MEGRYRAPARLGGRQETPPAARDVPGGIDVARSPRRLPYGPIRTRSDRPRHWTLRLPPRAPWVVTASRLR
ncbi:MAG: hypothetical protein AVDCRST_MAG49-3877 [uncultured Thermomicrobiales bacterium]|uniref:Uncharacterized protein n=1 Tax=uncultured Thermomicrobiales bacterium TaxID=1645740 RepID=A0A6J4VCK0_9BACT|nr:MAG: hypothetical protein AVDCRST_MAG49-3877 [uncultured Thermomicrobiales bacterium]